MVGCVCFYIVEVLYIDCFKGKVSGRSLFEVVTAIIADESVARHLRIQFSSF